MKMHGNCFIFPTWGIWYKLKYFFQLSRPLAVFITFFWKQICSKPSEQVILDYDYTFTTPYCGSGTIEVHEDKVCTPSFLNYFYYVTCWQQILILSSKNHIRNLEGIKEYTRHVRNLLSWMPKFFYISSLCVSLV